MQIAIFARGCERNATTGVGNYTRHLIAKMLELDHHHQYSIFCAFPPPEFAATSVALFPAPGVESNRYYRVLWENLWLPCRLRTLRPDIFLSTNFSVPIGLPGTLPVLAVVYDLIWFRLPDMFPRDTVGAARRRFQYTCRRARFLIVDSNHTGADIHQLFGFPESRICTIYPAVDHFRFCPELEGQDLRLEDLHQRLALPRPYCFWLGGYRPHKNLVGLCHAFCAAKRKFGFRERLVLAGLSGTDWHEVKKQLGGEPEGIASIGRVADEDLPYLYAGATCLVFPSFYEGFGLPVLEAMACGTPVICSRVASLPEVAGDAALMIDPNSEEELVEALGKVIGDGSLRQEMRHKGLIQTKKFSWQESAQMALSLLERLGCKGGAE